MEAMAAESLVASVWELDGFLTKVRWPVRIPENGQCSDIDVIGINATGTVRLAECKVPFGRHHVQVVDGELAENFGLQEPCNWLGRANNIERLWIDPPAWLPSIREVELLEFWICANIWFADEGSRRRASASVRRYVRSVCPRGLRSRVSVHVKSTCDVLLDVITKVRQREGHGRRFGQPILDSIRELVRYANPDANGGRRVERLIRETTRTELLRALGLSEDADNE